MSQITPVIIGAIVGAIFSGWIAWMIAKRNIKETNLASLAINRIQDRQKAAAIFKLAFLELLLFLKENIEPEGFTDFVSYLHRLYPQHAAAVITFTPYLNKAGVERTNRAWFNYKFPDGIAKGKEDKEAFPLNDYASIPEPQRIALEKIENLLSVCAHNF